MRRASLPLVLAVVTAALSHALPLRAELCARPDLVQAFPPDEARGVPTNASLWARYSSTAEYLGEDVAFGKKGDELQLLTASFNDKESLLSIVPPGPLEPGTSYVVEWPELRGYNTASLGRGTRVQFAVGDREDTEPPIFEGVEGVEWKLERRRDDCTDRVEERYVFDLSVGRAKDDGGEDSLALVVFQTKGPNIRDDDGPEPIAIAPVPESGKVRVRRAVDDAVGEVCFAIIARDLLGNPSASGSQEECVHTPSPPFFNGCRAAPQEGGVRARWWIMFALLWYGRARSTAFRGRNGVAAKLSTPR